MWLLLVIMGLLQSFASSDENYTQIACPVGTLCKQHGLEGCCPYHNATCCANGVSCCPHGMTCNLILHICMKGDVTSKPASVSKGFNVHSTITAGTNLKVSIEYCVDGTVCPDQSTCCEMQSGRYGCCPRPNAVCCSDLVHCCPQGFHCESHGYCYQSESATSTDEEVQLNELYFYGGNSTCCHDQTCCPLEDGTTGVCPIKDGVCCDGFCCPHGYECLQTTRKCIKI